MREEDKAKIEELLEKMQSSRSLPALSENVFEISRLTEDSDTSAADLASVIMRDCGLTSSLLVTANSTYYSPRFPVKTVSSAVTMLGFEKVQAIALGLSILEQTKNSANNQSMITMYAGSYFSGTLAMGLARKYDYSNPEEIFVAGLLYRLPRLALANAFPEQSKKMEKLIKDEGKSENDACQLIFGVLYDDICEAIVKLYKLPGKISAILENRESHLDPVLRLVEEAGTISNMLFGDKEGGQEAITQVEKRLQDILKTKNFSVSDFILDTCNNDKNISRFFNLKTDDIDMMVNILQWGKANPAQVLQKISIDDTLAEQTKSTEEKPETLIGHFLTELSICRREMTNINDLLMIAQEAIFRCLLDTAVFTAFFDRSKTILTGRLYVGENTSINASDFTINLDKSSSMINECIKTSSIARWEKAQEKLPLDQTLLERLKLQSALAAPIKALSHNIGIYFVGRTSNNPFNDREMIWLEEIVTHVSSGFESLRTKTNN